ncbi:class I SAM-dependent methyltransferase [Methylobacterium sp. SD21]|uniref:class I SAM-dependent methyltransferase n=1 Tax=Methylobacterium litchii TaxID=3138810 RepID=UPI00313E4CF5
MPIAAILDAIWRRPALWEKLRGFVRRTGYDTTDWVRSAMYRDAFAFIQSLQPEKLDVLEISGGNQWMRNLEFKSYLNTEYPGFDICAETLPQQFDLIIADQIFEHLPWPYRAGRNVHAMLKPGGHFVIATPFLVRIHRVPIDCSRWTPDGLSYLLQECGFAAEDIHAKSWGNRACVTGNFRKWRKRGFFGSLKNEPDFPVMVWAFARKAKGS